MSYILCIQFIYLCILHTYNYIIWLVVFRPTPLKNDGQLVSWDDDILNVMGKVMKFHGSKPPTSCDPDGNANFFIRIESG